MSDIAKSNKPVKKKEEFTVNVGDIFIDSRDSAFRILEKEKDNRYNYYTYEWLYDVLGGKWKVSKSQMSDTKEWRNDTISADSLKQYYKKISQKDFDVWLDKARKLLETGEMSEEFSLETKEEGTSTELVGLGSKEYLQTLEAGMQEKANQLQGMQNIISLYMQEQERKLDAYKRELEGAMAIFKKQIERVQRQITIIELYLGINEEIHQIKDGAPAGIDSPICFRQQVLFMDEETGITNAGGLDATRIDEFDEWLLTDDNYKKIIPEEKCVVTFKVRRYARDYGNADKNDDMKGENQYYTYFLIRNGDKLHRIFTNKIIIPERLFPRRNEMEKMFKKMQEEIKSTSFERNKQEAKDKAENRLYLYKKIAFFYQGLIDRTEVFSPVVPKISIFNMDEFEGCFNFIYDDELALPNGRIPFWDWHWELNNKLVRGSRIVLSDRRNRFGRNESRDDEKYRLLTKVSNYRSPENGIYEVDMMYGDKTEVIPHYYMEELEAKGLLIKKGNEIEKRYLIEYASASYSDHYLPLKGVTVRTFMAKDVFDRKDEEYIESYKCTFKQETFFIRYNSAEEVYGSWGDYDPHKRKNRISWKVEKHDDFIFNYDQIDTDSINFYLTSRADRHNYYQMLPMLKRVLAIREEELKWERGFVKMLVDNATKKYGEKLNTAACEQFTWDCIDWWKNKVIFKRPITKDDTKALRMIEERVLAESNKKRITTR